MNRKKQDITEDELLDIVWNRMSEDRIYTYNLVHVIEGVEMFKKEEISADEYLSILEDMEEKVLLSKQHFDEFVSETDEWTVETNLARKLLEEGLNKWLEALDMLRESVYDPTQDPEKAKEKAFEANENLVLLQELSEYVKKRDSQQ